MNFYLWFALLLLGLYLALNGVFEKVLAGSPPTRFDRCADVGLILVIVVLIGGGWFLAIGESQLQPHVITTSINGHVLSTFTATNPAYLTWETRPYLSTNGWEYRSYPVTNYYWQVWSIFRK